MRRHTREWLVVGVVWASMMLSGRVAAQSLEFTHVATIAGPAQLVELHGTRAFLAADRTLQLLDLSNPAAPAEKGTYEFPQPIRGFVVAGSLVYVAADVFGLGILDVSNADAPTLIGSWETPGQARSVAVFGATAFVADVLTGIDVVTVSNPTRPVPIGSVFLDGLANDLVASESLIYASDRPTGFYVVDPSVSGDTDPLGSLQMTQESFASVFFSQIKVIRTPGGSMRTGTLVAGGPLQLVDLSDPSAPVELPSYDTPGQAMDIAVKDNLAYVADDSEGLQVVDLSTPTAPTIVGTFATLAAARGVSVSESLVLVVVDGGDVHILREGLR